MRGSWTDPGSKLPPKADKIFVQQELLWLSSIDRVGCWLVAGLHRHRPQAVWLWNKHLGRPCRRSGIQLSLGHQRDNSTCMNVRVSCTSYVIACMCIHLILQNARARNSCSYTWYVLPVDVSRYFLGCLYTIMCDWACAIRCSCFFCLLILSKCQMPEFNKCDQELLVVFKGLRFHRWYPIDSLGISGLMIQKVRQEKVDPVWSKSLFQLSQGLPSTIDSCGHPAISPVPPARQVVLRPFWATGSWSCIRMANFWGNCRSGTRGWRSRAGSAQQKIHAVQSCHIHIAHMSRKLRKLGWTCMSQIEPTLSLPDSHSSQCCLWTVMSDMFWYVLITGDYWSPKKSPMKWMYDNVWNIYVHWMFIYIPILMWSFPNRGSVEIRPSRKLTTHPRGRTSGSFIQKKCLKRCKK